MSPQTTRRRLTVLLTFALMATMLTLTVRAPAPAEATHFRASQITWRPISSTTIQFSITNAFRRSGYGDNVFGSLVVPPSKCINPQTLSTKPCSGVGGLAGIGDVIYEYIGSTVFFPGDGTFIGSPIFGGALLYVITSIDPANNWLFGEALDPAKLPAVDTNISKRSGQAWGAGRSEGGGCPCWAAVTAATSKPTRLRPC